MNERKRKAEMLLEAVGDIDDELLNEAISYRRERRISTRAVAMAASLAIVFCLIAGSAMLPKLLSPDSGGDGNDKPSIDGEGNYADEDVKELIGLDSVFVNLSNLGKYSYVTDPDALPYLSGEVYIVWKYQGEERYYLSKPLEDAQFETVKNALGRGREAGNTSPSINVKVWVLLGDGRVISPYLKGSNGNISSEIFDYEVEIIPLDGFNDKITAILS